MTEDKIPSAVVLGSVHMDLIATARRLPGRGESVVGQGFTISPGGKAGNQACQLVKCGTDAFILTRLGDDAFGRQLFEHLTSRGVDPSLITIDASQPTGASTVFVAEGDYSSIIVSGAAGGLTAADIESHRASLEAADALILQLELPVAVSIPAARIAKAKGRYVALYASPAPDGLAEIPKELLQAVSVLIVNTFEAGRLLGRTFSNAESPSAAAELAKKSGVELVTVTAGASGSAAVQLGEAFFQPSYFAKVVDSVGAGDAYLATFVTAQLEGLPLQQSLKRAAAAGALAVSRSGSSAELISRRDIDQFLGA
jgi:ribokinase